MVPLMRAPVARWRVRPTLVLALTWFCWIVAPLPAHARPGAPLDVEVALEGHESYSTRVLLAELEFWLEDLRRDPHDVGAREDIAYELQQFYHAEGYPRATVTSSEPNTEDDPVRIVFRIDEGPLEVLDTLTFEGATHFDHARLRQAFEWNRRGLFGIFGQGPITFTEDILEAGCVGVRLLYRLDGFREVEARPTISREEDEDRIRVAVNVLISEGRRFRVGEITFDPDLPADGLRTACRVDRGDVFTPRLPIEVEQRIERFFADRGYFSASARVEPTVDPIGVVHLHANYQLGEVAKIGRIDFVGLETTRESWARAHVTFETDQLFRRTEFERTRAALLQSRLFQTVRVVGVPDETESDRIRVEIRVEEKKTIRGAIRAGFGSYELGRIGAEILHRNVLGRGLLWRLRGKVSFRGEETESELRVPLIAGEELAFSVRGLYRRFEEPSFTRQETRGTASIETPIARYFRASTGFEVRDQKVLDPEVTVDPELRINSRSTLLFASGSRDTRDSPLDPSTGSFQRVRVEWADRLIGSELDFVRTTVRSTFLFSPYPGIRLALGGRFGWIEPTANQEIPLGERFFIGGARSHRAFAEGELGPKDANNEPLGGGAYLLGNFEVRAVVWSPFEIAVFLDAGALVPEFDDLGHGGDRYGAGAGLIWTTPIGPVRADLGFNLSPRSEEDDWVFHFMIGHPF
ncbi:MAG: BamA/TamA family outer membrane protein [Planctomycetota bacterium]